MILVWKLNATSKISSPPRSYIRPNVTSIGPFIRCSLISSFYLVDRGLWHRLPGTGNLRFYSITTFIRAITSLLQIRQVAHHRSVTCSLQGLSPTRRVARAAPSGDLALGVVHLPWVEEVSRAYLRKTPEEECLGQTKNNAPPRRNLTPTPPPSQRD